MSINQLLPLIGTPNLNLPAAPTAIVAALVNDSSTAATVSFTLPVNQISDIVEITVISYPDLSSYSFTLLESHLNTTTGRGYVTIASLPMYNQRYKFQVRARNTYGLGVASDYSNIITTPLGPAAAPPAPVATKAGATSISVTVYPLLLESDYKITQYTVQSNPPSVSKTVKVNGSQSYNVLFENLARETSYSFFSTAYNGFGPSAASPNSNSIITDPITEPSAPIISNINTYGGVETAYLAWKPPIDNGGQEVLYYTISLTRSGGPNYGNYDVGTYNTSYVFSNVAANSGYVASVYATNSVGTSIPGTKTGIIVTAPVPSGNINFNTDSTWTVPNNVSWIAVAGVGAGGNGSPTYGGGGGQAEGAWVSVTPGETLDIQIGQPTDSGSAIDTVLFRSSTPIFTAKSGRGLLYGGITNNNTPGWYRGGASPAPGSTLGKASWTQSYGGDSWSSAESSAGLNFGGGGGPKYIGIPGATTYGTGQFQSLVNSQQGLMAGLVEIDFSGSPGQGQTVNYGGTFTGNWNPIKYGYTYNFTSLGWYRQLAISGNPFSSISGLQGATANATYVKQQYVSSINKYFQISGSTYPSTGPIPLKINFFNNNNKGDPNDTGSFAWGEQKGSLNQGGVGGYGAGGGSGPTPGRGGPGILQIWWGSQIPPGFYDTNILGPGP